MRTMQKLMQPMIGILLIAGLLINYAFTLQDGSNKAYQQHDLLTKTENFTQTDELCEECSKPLIYREAEEIEKAKKLYPKSKSFFEKGFIYVSCTTSETCKKQEGICIVKGIKIVADGDGEVYEPLVSKKGETFSSTEKTFNNKSWHKLSTKNTTYKKIKCACEKPKKGNGEKKVIQNNKPKKKGKCKKKVLRGASDIEFAIKSYSNAGRFFQKGFVYVACEPDAVCKESKCRCVVFFKEDGKEKSSYSSRTFTPNKRAAKTYRNKRWHKISGKAKSIECRCIK